MLPLAGITVSHEALEIFYGDRLVEFAPVAGRFTRVDADTAQRPWEWELLPVCREEGLGLLAWSPLAGGWLTGKYKRNQSPPPDSRVGRQDRWDDQPEQRESELTWRVTETLVEIGKDRGKTPAQVALNWLLHQAGVTTAILGARTLDQLKENLGSIGWALSDQEMEKIQASSEIPLPYPYRFIERYTRKRETM